MRVGGTISPHVLFTILFSFFCPHTNHIQSQVGAWVDDYPEPPVCRSPPPAAVMHIATLLCQLFDPPF